MKSIALTVAIASVLATLSSPAAAVFIDFNALPATGSFTGTPLPASVLTTQLAPLGIVFGRPGLSAGVAVAMDGANVASPPNGICGLDVAGIIPGFCAGDIYFNFVSGANPGVTSSVSFSLGDAGGDLDLWTINVFDVNDGLLEARTVSSIALTTVSFTLMDMHRFHIDYLTPPNGYLLDNLEFAAPTPVGTVGTPAPEPGSLALIGMALGIFGIARRRMKI